MKLRVTSIFFGLFVVMLTACGGGGGGGTTTSTTPTSPTEPALPPSITSFTSASSTIDAGTSTTLTAVFVNGTGYINNGVGAITSGTPISVSPTTNTTYTLTVTNSENTSVAANTTISVVQKPVISSFTSSKMTMTAGEPGATLTGYFANGYGKIKSGNVSIQVNSGNGYTIRPNVTSTYTLEVENATGDVASQLLTVAVNAPGAFVSAPNMSTARSGATVTMLQDGKVLVTGGKGGTVIQATAEIYDPVTGKFTSTGSMTIARQYHAASLLPDGKVLIAGGLVPENNNTASVPTNLMEIYDPATGQFSALAVVMAVKRDSFRMTQLQDGKVFIVGGEQFLDRSKGEIFDPATGTLSLPVAMSFQTDNPETVLLDNGKVLILDVTAALYDPATNTFAVPGANGALTYSRESAEAIKLQDGRVFIYGSVEVDSYPEIYDPSTDSFAVVNTTFAGISVGDSRTRDSSLVLLGDGRVMILSSVWFDTLQDTTLIFNPADNTLTGGGLTLYKHQYQEVVKLNTGKLLLIPSDLSDSAAELIDPANNYATATTGTGSQIEIREYGTATRLADGKVLLVGGFPSYPSTVFRAEVYDPATGKYSPSGSLKQNRLMHAAIALPNGKVLIIGGSDGTTALTSIESHDPATGLFSEAGNLSVARANHTATLLNDGTVLITGGNNWYASTTGNASAEIYDPVTATSTLLSDSMNVARAYHNATLLDNGKVLITGGTGADTTIPSALYDPSTGLFSTTAGLMSIDLREMHATTKLANGKVLIVGVDKVAQLYDPALDRFTDTGKLNFYAMYRQTVLMADGRVAIIGGNNGHYRAAIEIYDPATDMFHVAGRMMVARARPHATLLTNGKVLISGGFNGAEQTYSELF